uniref:Uncharacterized protein n=1 Tax=Anguilla anguilla TaxID=7936 RepID=A0A0E9RIQ8_ANGAN
MPVLFLKLFFLFGFMRNFVVLIKLVNFLDLLAFQRQRKGMFY